jgi:hypothetical protein
MLVSVHDVAEFAHKENGTNVAHWVFDNGYSGGFYVALGLPMLSGCQCGNNLSPSGALIGRNGFIHCHDCATAEDEFDSLKEAFDFLELGDSKF